MEPLVALPNAGFDAAELLQNITEGRSGDLDWQSGRAFSLVYNAADPTLEALQHDVAGLFLHDNALNPMAYPSLRQMEVDLVAMSADLLGTDSRSGALTSGGTESIFCAVQAARDHARAELGIAEPSILLPSTAHPAFTKAAKYLDIEAHRVPVRNDGRADVAATEAAIDETTALLVGSAPCYPYGLIDPVTELAALASARGLLCHVDACLGGWLLPFWSDLGEEVAPWTFAVDGVTSLSADIHKYGYAYKGASVVLYRDRALLKRQFFSFDDWPGGFYGSATPAGTRPAPPIVGAWATLVHLGREGLVAKARLVHEATKGFLAAIDAVEGFEVVHDPDMSVFMFAASGAPEQRVPVTRAVADQLLGRGWKIDVQQEGIHLMMSPGHVDVVDDFAADLHASVAAARNNAPSPSDPGHRESYASRAN